MTALHPSMDRARVEPSRGDERVARRSQQATAALGILLAGISVFAVSSALLNARSADSAIEATRLADHYADASRAVAREESLERKYRLEPGPEVRVKFDAAEKELVRSLSWVRDDGAESDGVLAEQVLDRHLTYLRAIDSLFAAVDSGNATEVLRIDNDLVDPQFEAIETSVEAASSTHHEAATRQLSTLRKLETTTARLTPFIFVGGLLLAIGLAAISRGHGRLLVRERGQALHDSLHDALTGLPNRTLLGDRLGQCLRSGQRSGQMTGLLLIDLDRFKEINDTFGHHCGDRVLVDVSARLRSAVRDGDTVARLGGDEFAVLLPDVADLAAAQAVGEKILLALEPSMEVEGVGLEIEASIGVVIDGVHGNDGDLLLQRADVAMYQAKGQGGGVCAYDPESDEYSPARLTLLGELRRALDEDELVLFYQPKVSVSTGELVGVEALVRWRHPTRGLIFPDQFIPAAEHTGLIGPLTVNVLHQALRQARVWLDEGRMLPVAVNLSARTLLSDTLPDEVQAQLEFHGVPAGLLELEVTESAIMHDPKRAKKLLGRLADLGIRISIDDFGAGYTSLGQLKDLPVHELKVDRSFVSDMSEVASQAIIVRSVVDLGHNLGLTIVAEGVETSAVLDGLVDFGCDIAQGYHFSKAVDADALDTWHREYLASRCEVAAAVSGGAQALNTI